MCLPTADGLLPRPFTHQASHKALSKDQKRSMKASKNKVLPFYLRVKPE